MVEQEAHFRSLLETAIQSLSESDTTATMPTVSADDRRQIGALLYRASEGAPWGLDVWRVVCGQSDDTPMTTVEQEWSIVIGDAVDGTDDLGKFYEELHAVVKRCAPSWQAYTTFLRSIEHPISYQMPNAGCLIATVSSGVTGRTP